MSLPLSDHVQEPLFDVPAPPPGTVWEWVSGFGWVERPLTADRVALIQDEEGGS